MEIGALSYKLSLETSNFFRGLSNVYRRIQVLSQLKTDVGVNVHANTASALRELQEVFNAGLSVINVLNSNPNMKFSTNFKELADDFINLSGKIESSLYKALSAQEFEVKGDAVETYRKKLQKVGEQLVNMETGEILDLSGLTEELNIKELDTYLEELDKIPSEMDEIIREYLKLKETLKQPIEPGKQMTLADFGDFEKTLTPDIDTSKATESFNDYVNGLGDASSTLIDNVADIPDKFYKATEDIKFPDLTADIDTQGVSEDVSKVNNELNKIQKEVEITPKIDFAEGKNLKSMEDNTRTDTTPIDTSKIDVSKVGEQTTKAAVDITEALAKIAELQKALEALQAYAEIKMSIDSAAFDSRLEELRTNIESFIDGTFVKNVNAYVDFYLSNDEEKKLENFKAKYEEIQNLGNISLKVTVSAAKKKLDELKQRLTEFSQMEMSAVNIPIAVMNSESFYEEANALYDEIQEYFYGQPIAVPVEFIEDVAGAQNLRTLISKLQGEMSTATLTPKFAENSGLPTYAELIALLGRLQSWYDAHPIKVNFSSEVNAESVQELKDLLSNIQEWYNLNPLKLVFDSTGTDSQYSNLQQLIANLQDQLDKNPLHLQFGKDEGIDPFTMRNIVGIFQKDLDRHPLHLQFGKDEGIDPFTMRNLVGIYQVDLNKHPLHFKFGDVNTDGAPTYAELIALLGRLQSWYDAHPIKVNFSSEVNAESVQELKDLLSNIQEWYNLNPLKLVFDSTGTDSQYSNLQQLIMSLQDYCNNNPLVLSIFINDQDVTNKVNAINEMLDSLETISGSIKIGANLDAFSQSLEKVEEDLKNLSRKTGKVSILGDISKLKTSISQAKELLKEVNKLKGTTRILSDASAVIKTVTSVKAKIKEINDLSAKVNVLGSIDDIEDKVDKIKNYVNEVNQLSGHVKISSDIFEAVVNFEQVKKDIAQIKKDVDSLNAFNGSIKIAVETSADITAAQAELTKLGQAVDLIEDYKAELTVTANTDSAKNEIDLIGLQISSMKQELMKTSIKIPVSFEPTWNRPENLKPKWDDTAFNLEAEEAYPGNRNNNVVFEAVLYTEVFDNALDVLYKEINNLRAEAAKPIIFAVNARGLRITMRDGAALAESLEGLQRIIEDYPLIIKPTIEKDLKNMWTEYEVKNIRDNLEAVGGKTYKITIDSNIKEYSAAASRVNTYLDRIPKQVRTSWFLDYSQDAPKIDEINAKLDALTEDVIIPVKITLDNNDSITGTANAAMQALPSGKEILATFNIDTTTVDAAQAKLDKLSETVKNLATNKIISVSVDLDTTKLSLDNITLDGSSLKITGVKITEIDSVDTASIQNRLNTLSGGVTIPIMTDNTQAMAAMDDVSMRLTKLSTGISIPLVTAADFTAIQKGLKSLNASCQNLGAKFAAIGQNANIKVTADTSDIDQALSDIADALITLHGNSNFNFKANVDSGKKQVNEVGDEAQRKAQEISRYISQQMDGLASQGYEMINSWGSAFAGASWLYVLREASNILGNIVSQSNNFVMDMERSTISFTYLLQDYTKAQAMIRELQGFAIESPLNFSGATRGVQQLMVMGFSAMDSLEMLETITDAAAVSGRDMDDSIQRIALALGQIKQTGILRAQEANQLIDVNIPVYELLQEQLGISLTSSDLGEAKIESEKAIDAILTGLKEKYGGASEAMQLTIAGSISAITDSFSVLYQQLSSPIVAHIRNLLQDVNTAIQGITKSLQELSFEDFMEKIFPESVIESATEIIYNFQMSFVILRKYLEGFITWMTNSFNAFAGTFSTLYNGFNNFFVGIYAAFSKWYKFSESFRDVAHFLGFTVILAAVTSAARLFLKVLSPLTSVLFLIPKAIATVVTSLLSMNLAMAASNIAVVALLALLGYLIYRAGLFKNIWNSLAGIFDQGKISADDYSDAIKDLGEQLNDANKDVGELADTVDDNFNQSFDEVFLIDPSEADSVDAIAGTLGTLGDVLTGINDISGLKIDLSDAFNVDTLKVAWDKVVDEIKKYIGDFDYSDIANAIGAGLSTLTLTGNPFLSLITALVGMFWDELAEQLGIDPANGDKLIGGAIGLGVTKVIGKLANWKWDDYVKWGPGVAGIAAGVWPAITEALDQVDKKGYVYNWGEVIGELDFSLIFSGVSWIFNGQKFTEASKAFDAAVKKAELENFGKKDKLSLDNLQTTVGDQLKAAGFTEVTKGGYQLASAVSVAADLVFAWRLGEMTNDIMELDIMGAVWDALPLATGFAIANFYGAPALSVPVAAVMTLTFEAVKAAVDANFDMNEALEELKESATLGTSGGEKGVAAGRLKTQSEWEALVINRLESIGSSQQLPATLNGIKEQYEAATGKSFADFFKSLTGVDQDTYAMMIDMFLEWRDLNFKDARLEQDFKKDASNLNAVGQKIFALTISEGQYNRTDLYNKQVNNSESYKKLSKVFEETNGTYKTLNQLLDVRDSEIQSIIDNLNNSQSLTTDQLLLLTRFTDEDWQTVQDNLNSDAAVRALQNITNSLGQYGVAYREAVKEIETTTSNINEEEISEALNQYRTKVGGVYKSLDDDGENTINELNEIINTLTLPEIEWDKIYNYFEEIGAPQEILDAVIVARDSYTTLGNYSQEAIKTAVQETEKAAEKLGHLAPDIQTQIDSLKNYLKNIDWSAWEQYLRDIGFTEEQIKATLDPMKQAAQTLEDGLTTVETTASDHIASAASTVLDNTETRANDWLTRMSTLKNKIGIATSDVLKKFSELFTSDKKDFNFLNLGDFSLNLQLSKTKGSAQYGKEVRTQTAYATGGIVDREQIARVGEGGKREAIIPLENQSAMAPFAEAVANGVSSVLGPMISSINSGGSNTQQLQPVYVGTLIADDRGLRELQRKMNVIQLKESRRG